MKHIKTFENAIKHTDEIAINHILRQQSKDLEDLMNFIKEFDSNKDHCARRYFISDGQILIHYGYNTIKYNKLFSILLNNDDKYLYISIRLHQNWNADRLIEISKFYNYINRILNRYDIDSSVNIKNRTVFNTHFKIPLELKDYIFKIIHEYKIELDANKYNL